MCNKYKSTFNLYTCQNICHKLICQYCVCLVHGMELCFLYYYIVWMELCHVYDMDLCLLCITVYCIGLCLPCILYGALYAMYMVWSCVYCMELCILYGVVYIVWSYVYGMELCIWYEAMFAMYRTCLGEKGAQGKGSF